MKTVPVREVILIVVIVAIVFFILGYYRGVDDTMSAGLKIFRELLDREKIKFDIDDQMIKNLYTQYKETINGCLFVQNASIYSN